MRILLQCGLLAALLALWAMVDLSNAAAPCGGCQSGADVTTSQKACYKATRNTKQEKHRTCKPARTLGRRRRPRACRHTYTYRTKVYYTKGAAYCCNGYLLYGATCVKNTCGISKYSNAGIAASSFSPVIVGGRSARPNEFPWQVSLRRSGSNRHFCGGTIIDSRHILTAAHCVRAVSSFRVYVGVHRLSSTESTQQIHSVASSTVHQTFISSNLANDVAIIRLTTPISFSANVQRACLPTSSSKSYVNRDVIISGWGRTSTDGALPKTLQYAAVRITSAKYCSKYYRISKSILCVTDNKGDRHKSACYGDSGGPMVVKEPDGKWYVVGVSSFVSLSAGCAGGLPFGYQNVAYHLSWIKSKTT